MIAMSCGEEIVAKIRFESGKTCPSLQICFVGTEPTLAVVVISVGVRCAVSYRWVSNIYCNDVSDNIHI